MFDYGKQSCGKLLNGNIVNVVFLGYDMVARPGTMANTAKKKIVVVLFLLFLLTKSCRGVIFRIREGVKNEAVFRFVDDLYRENGFILPFERLLHPYIRHLSENVSTNKNRCGTIRQDGVGVCRKLEYAKNCLI